jgi:hypothetical protein
LRDVPIDLSSVSIEIPEIPLSGGAFNDGSKPQQARPPSLQADPTVAFQQEATYR